MELFAIHANIGGWESSAKETKRVSTFIVTGGSPTLQLKEHA